jgi:glycosyltransferase involved in cell wall biosynthesis
MSLKFSIVIPNYNSGAVLERALGSLVSQQADLQLIVVDAESTDASREIIERYRSKLDTLIIEPDEGQADALNKGFCHATGDIFGWLCADDELRPGALKHVARIFYAQPDTDVVLGGCERVYADGSRQTIVPDDDPWGKIGVKNVIEQSSTFWRARLHRKCEPLDTGFQLAFDWDLWCKMARARAHVHRLEQVVANYYFSADNKTSRAGELFAREAFEILRRYGPLNGKLAHVYRLLYRHFDLHGCYDEPPTCTRARGAVFMATHRVLRRTITARLLYMYNWHFASLQQRGKQWW